MSEYLDWHKLTPDQIYYLIFKPAEDRYISIGREMGLDSIIDLEKIRPKNYIIKGNFGEYNEYAGWYNPSDDTLTLNIELLNKDRLYLYHTLFHEYSHKLRHLIYESISKLYHKDRDNFIEEAAAEALNFVFLSKEFGEEKIKNFAKKIIVAAWGEAIPVYSDGKYIYYAYTIRKAGIKRLPHDFGVVLGYILLNMDENKQKEYIVKLLKTYTKDDLMNLLYDIEKDLPKNDEIIKYYNLLRNIIEGKAYILYTF